MDLKAILHQEKEWQCERTNLTKYKNHNNKGDFYDKMDLSKLF